MNNRNVRDDLNRVHLLNGISLLGVLTFVEGLAVLVIIARQPSEIQAQVFLGFSVRRWILILAHITSLLVIGLTVWRIRYGTTLVSKVVAIFENQRLLTSLFVILFVLIISALVISLRSATPGQMQPYLQPYVLWVLFASLQFWILLCVRLWKPLWSAIQTYTPTSRSVESYPLSPFTKIIFILIAGTYAFLQAHSFLIVRSVAIRGDAVEYILPHVDLGFTDLGFWIWSKPWVTLAVYRSVGYSLEWIDFIQTAFSGLAWFLLAWVVSLALQKQWLKVLAFSFVLGFSLTEPVQLWNHVALSESISISIMMLVLANSISLVQRWRWHKVITLCLLFFLWTNIRESNIYLDLMIAAGLFFLGLFKKNSRYAWGIVLSIVLAAAIQLYLSNLKSIPRWVIPLGNVVTQRILPNQAYRDFFRERGMPLSAEVMSLSNQWIYSDNLAFFDDKNLRDFQKWFYRSGRITYIEFLIRHPSYTIQSPLENIDLILVPTADLNDHRNSNYVSDLPVWIQELLFPMQWFWLYLWVSLTTLGALLFSMKWAHGKSSMILFLFFLLSIPHFFLTFHGDAAEVGRHSIQANIQFRLAIPLLCLYSLERMNLPRFNLSLPKGLFGPAKR